MAADKVPRITVWPRVARTLIERGELAAPGVGALFRSGLIISSSHLGWLGCRSRTGRS